MTSQRGAERGRGAKEAGQKTRQGRHEKRSQAPGEDVLDAWEHFFREAFPKMPPPEVTPEMFERVVRSARFIVRKFRWRSNAAAS
jgi:hypothetical protein